MRFVDFLKTTVLLSAGAATALATVTVLAAAAAGTESQVVAIAVGWWLLSSVIGLYLGRRAEVNPPITRLLADAKATTTLPEHRPGAVLLNRLWPLLLFALLAGGLAFLAPQIPGIGAGFAITWSLAWRRQESAVAAIEERDGVRFYVLGTSPVRPMALQRTPGFKAIRPEGAGGAAG